MPMDSKNTSSQPAQQKPVYGIFSLVSPFLGFIAAFCFTATQNDESQADSLYHGVLFFVIIIAAIIAGLISAVASLTLRERYWGLGAFGLALNGCPVLFVMCHVSL